MTEASLRPALAAGVSLAAALLIVASGRRPNLREAWTFLAGLVKLGLVASMLPGVLEGRVYEARLLSLGPGLELAFKADALGLYFALLASFLWLFTSLYSVGYMRSLKEHAQTRYFASFAVCMGSAVGVAFAANLLTFLVAYEMLSVATYPLVVHLETPEARRAGKEYLAYLLTAGACLLLAVAWTYALTGTGEFAAGGFLSGAGSPRVLTAIFVLFMVGCGVKAGMMPLHAWLPSAMVAPTPVSALLHAVAVVKAGVFGCLRVMGFVFGPELMRELGVAWPMAAAAGFTILASSMIALTHDQLKRRLAYSTIGQLSYILLGAALLTPAAWAGAVLHLANHAFMKITLFFCAGAIYVGSKRTDISRMAGLGRRMPVTFAAFAVGALGFSGLPGLAGFVSKLFLCRGAVEAGQLWAAAFLLASGLLNAAYLLPVVKLGFFEEGDPGDAREAPKSMLAALLVGAALSAAFGAVPGLVDAQWQLAAEVARQVTGVLP